MPCAVTDKQVAAYLPLCDSLAKRFNGVGGAEYDDLRQEGMIAVWQTLEKGLLPSRLFVANRMRTWIRKCRRGGFTGYADPADPFS